jgi:hypothetical protein
MKDTDVNESNTPNGSTLDQPSDLVTPAPGRSGAALAGALLVVIGGGMIAERTGLLSLEWRSSIWPVLLMVFGAASLVRSNEEGRQGLFFVIAGAWWYAGLAGWISMLQTWPLLIVGLGASVVLQALTVPTRQPRRLWKHGTRESGLMPLVLVAILAGALFSGRDRIGSYTSSDGGFRVVSVMSRTRHGLTGEQAASGTLVTVMGQNEIDLGHANVPAGGTFVIDGITVMGSSVLYVPTGWSVDPSNLSVFGRVRDQRTSTDPPAAGAPRLQLRGAVVFGSIELRSPGDTSEEDKQ